MNKHQTLELIANLSTEVSKMPIIIELAGTPNSGKSTIANEIDSIFRRHKIKCKVICESARYCKIHNKKTPQFNYWTALETIQRILSEIDRGYKIIICDRGIFDAITWMRFYLNNNLLSKKDYNTVVNFYQLNEWKQYVYCVNVITCAPAISIKRDIDYSEFGMYGSIVNPLILPKINLAIEEAVNDYKNNFNIKCFDTSTDIKKIKEDIVNHILEMLLFYLR